MKVHDMYPITPPCASFSGDSRNVCCTMPSINMHMSLLSGYMHKYLRVSIARSPQLCSATLMNTLRAQSATLVN